jgi:flagellar basal body rod protein FlgB
MNCKMTFMAVVLVMFGTVMHGENIISNVLFDSTAVRLEDAIYDMNKKQKATAYNIANASTPGFRPIRYEDEIQEAIRLYGDSSMLDVVNVDDEMVRSTKIRLKHSAYVRLLSTKIGITKKVVTLGKGG